MADRGMTTTGKNEQGLGTGAKGQGKRRKATRSATRSATRKAEVQATHSRSPSSKVYDAAMASRLPSPLNAKAEMLVEYRRNWHEAGEKGKEA